MENDAVRDHELQRARFDIKNASAFVDCEVKKMHESLSQNAESQYSVRCPRYGYFDIKLEDGESFDDLEGIIKISRRLGCSACDVACESET